MSGAAAQPFLELINANKGIIHKVTKMYMDSAEDQEDLFQEIVMQLWKAYPSFKGNSKFTTWMYRVALNTAIVFFKKENRKVDKTTLTAQIDIADINESLRKKKNWPICIKEYRS